MSGSRGSRTSRRSGGGSRRSARPVRRSTSSGTPRRSAAARTAHRTTSTLRSVRVARPSIASKRRRAARTAVSSGYTERGLSDSVSSGILSGISNGIDRVNPIYLNEATLDVDGDGDFDFIDFAIIAFFFIMFALAVYGFYCFISSGATDTANMVGAETLYVEPQSEYYADAVAYEDSEYVYPPGEVSEVDEVLADFIDYEACMQTEYGEVFVYCPVFEVEYDWDTNNYSLLEPESYIGWFIFEGVLVEAETEVLLELTWIYIYADYERIPDWDQELIGYCEPTALPLEYSICIIEGEYYLIYGEYKEDPYDGYEYWFPTEYVYLLNQ